MNYKSWKNLLLAACLVIPSMSHAEGSGDDLLSLLGGGEDVQAGRVLNSDVLRQVIGQPSPEQNIFIQFFAKGELEKALFQWPSAFEGTTFAKSPSGRALHALLLYRNGIQVTALEGLLAIDKPTEIAPELRQLWKSTVPETAAVWNSVHIAKWDPIWTEMFGGLAEVRVRGRQIFGAEQMALLEELIKKAPPESRERALLEWQLVLALAEKEEPAQAAKTLAHLMKVSNNPIGTDLMTITAARLLYQNGFLDAAINYYEKVPKTSDYWFDAQEEMGWAFIRKGEPGRTLAITKTLVVPAFRAQVGPEPVFLRSLSLLKVCDYPEVTKSFGLFRERFQGKTKDLMALIDSADTPATKMLVTRLKEGEVKLADLGDDASRLPRFSTRDESLRQFVQSEKVLETEAKRAADLYARSLNGGTAQVGFQGALESLKQTVETRVQLARSMTMGRVKALAQEEVNEVGQILQKLHIVEAEVLQQVALSDRVVAAIGPDKTKKKTKRPSVGSDRLWFPDESETWFDELSNYQVDIQKGCGTVKR